MAAPFSTRLFRTEELSFPTDEPRLICVVEPTPKTVEARDAAEEENHGKPCLTQLCAQHKAEIDALIQEHGAVLFRGWEPEAELAGQIDAFERVLEGLGVKLSNEYRPGVAPRVQRGKWAFTSTEAPPFLSILPHTEMTYSNLRPEKIAFLCAQAPLNHGETPLFNCRGTWNTLSDLSKGGNGQASVAASLLEKLENGVCEFQRKFPGEATDWDKNASKAAAETRENNPPQNLENGIGSTKGGAQWQRSFDSSDPACVEKFCEEAGMKYAWEQPAAEGEPKALHTSSFVPSIVKHPKTGEPCVQLQTPLMGKIAYDVMVDLFPERFGQDVNPEYHEHVNSAKVAPPFKPLRFHSSQGHSAILTDEETRLFYRTVWEHSVVFKWEANDILVIDNISTAHARMNVDVKSGGPRKILACLGDVYDVRNVERFETMPSREAVSAFLKKH